MKKFYKFLLLILMIIVSFTACNTVPINNVSYATFYGLVRYNEEYEELFIYIPNVGDVEIPEYDKIYGIDEDSYDNNSYQLKNGDYIVIGFKYVASWDDNSVKIYETYPAKFDRKADYISVYKENISYYKNDNGYELAFPLENDLEININDTLAFLELKGDKNGLKVTKIAEGTVLSINDNIVTVSLNLLVDEKDFFNRFINVHVELNYDY